MSPAASKAGRRFSSPNRRIRRPWGSSKRAIAPTKSRRPPAAGRNLIAEEDEARLERSRAYTVEQLIERYVAKRVRGRLRTAEDIERRLIRSLAPIKKMRADEVRRRHVRDLLDEVAEDGREREAEKRRQVIGAMFRWAIGKDILENDPTAGIPVYDPGTPRDRILAEHEIKKLLDWLASGDAPPDHADALRLQLLLGSRIGEVAGIMAQEIDRQTWIWTLPGERSKNGRPRTTPLLGWAARSSKASWRQDADALFRTERNTALSSTSVAAWLRSARLRGRVPIDHFGTHDLRRTVASQMDEMGIARDVIGALIGHESGDRGATVLRRHYLKSEGLEKKKAALRAWEAKLRSIAEGGGSGLANVVVLNR